MFAFSTDRPEIPASLADRVRPLSTASSRRIPVGAPWEEVLPDAGLRRGTTVSVHAVPGSGSLTLALSLLGAASNRGHWCAVVDVDDPGVVAMHELGIDLRRVLFVPRPRGAWAECAADLLEGVDVVVLKTPSAPSHGTARRLVGRVRERGGVLVVLSEPGAPWPLPVDLSLEILSSQWATNSRLESRRSLVRVSGRGAARRAREYALALPGGAGRVLAS